MSKKKTTQDQINLIEKLRAERYTIPEMASKVGLSYRTVSEIAAKFPLPEKESKKASEAVKPTSINVTNAKAVFTKDTLHTRIPFSTPAKEFICNATSLGTYKGTELKYRK